MFNIEYGEGMLQPLGVGVFLLQILAAGSNEKYLLKLMSNLLLEKLGVNLDTYYDDLHRTLDNQ